MFYANRESKVFIGLARLYWQYKLTELVEFLENKLTSPTLVLFGSLSKAETKPDSDIDLAIFAAKRNVDSGLLIASDSIGLQVATNVDATISSRSSQTSVDAMQTDVTAIQATLNDLSTKIDTIDTVVDAIYAQQQTGATTGLPAETYALLEDVSNDLNSISGDKGYNLDDIYKTSANVDLSDLKDIKNRMLALQAMVEFNNLLIDKVAN